MDVNMAPFLNFMLATVVAFGLSFGTFLMYRRLGLSPMEDKLISRLKDNAEALEVRVGQLEEQVSNEQTQRIALEAELKTLRNTVADLAIENTILRKKLGMEPR